MRNDGKEAEKAFLDIMKSRDGVVIERFYDQADLRGLNGGRAVGDFPKASDFLVTEDGNICYIEVKSVQSSTSFPFSNLERAQKSAALRQAAAGGCYCIRIFSYGLGEWFTLTAAHLKRLLDAGRASVKFSELEPW